MILQTKSRLIFVFITALILSLATEAAWATKERGGGNVTRDGKIAEAGQDQASVELSHESIREILKPFAQQIATDLPDLETTLLFQFDSRTRWYLNDSFNAEGCHFKTSVSLETQTVACQEVDTEGLGEIRILRSYWERATRAEKADLVLHERLRNILFYNGTGACESCLYRAVLDFKNLQTLGLYKLRANLLANGFGLYLFATEKQQVLSVARSRLAQACKLPGQNAFQNHLLTTNVVAAVPMEQIEALSHLMWLMGNNDRSQCLDLNDSVMIAYDTWDFRRVRHY